MTIEIGPSIVLEENEIILFEKRLEQDLLRPVQFVKVDLTKALDKINFIQSGTKNK